MENKNSEVNVMEQPASPSLPDTQESLKKGPRMLPVKTLLLVGLIAAVGLILVLILIFSKQPNTSPNSRTSQETIPSTQIPKFTSTKYEDRSALGKVKN